MEIYKNKRKLSIKLFVIFSINRQFLFLGKLSLVLSLIFFFFSIYIERIARFEVEKLLSIYKISICFLVLTLLLPPLPTPMSSKSSPTETKKIQFHFWDKNRTFTLLLWTVVLITFKLLCFLCRLT